MIRPEYYKMPNQNATEDFLVKKAEFTSNVANVLLLSFQTKINPIINKLPKHGLDAKLQYLNAIKTNWADLTAPDYDLILAVCKRHEQRLDFTHILKFLIANQDIQLSQKPFFVIDSGDVSFQTLILNIYTVFESSLIEAVEEFWIAENSVIDMETTGYDFSNILSESTSAKFGILNAVLELKPKLNLWQKLLIIVRKSINSEN